MARGRGRRKLKGDIVAFRTKCFLVRMSTLRAIPELGQIAAIRQRLYLVEQPRQPVNPAGSAAVRPIPIDTPYSSRTPRPGVMSRRAPDVSLHWQRRQDNERLRTP